MAGVVAQANGRNGQKKLIEQTGQKSPGYAHALGYALSNRVWMVVAVQVWNVKA